MKIIGTEKIKGVLDLSSIKMQLKKGQSLNVRDDDFWQSDVQTALSLGFLRSEGSVQNDCKEDGNKVVKCKNTHCRSISMKENDAEIKPGQVFTLKQKEIESPAVKSAVSRGLIKILSMASEEVDEGSVSVTKLLSGEEDIEIDGFEEDDVSISDLLTKKPAIDTNEEIPAATVIIKEANIKPVKDTKEVVWNQHQEDMEVRSIESTTKVITSEDPDPVDANEGDPKGKSVVVDPNKTRYQKYKKDENVIFVDKESEKERIQAHPTMDPDKKKLAAQNADIDIIDEVDEDEKRRQQHPVLGKQNPESNGIEFIG